VVVAALVAGSGLLIEAGLGFDLVPHLALHGSRASLGFGAGLVAAGAIGVLALRRLSTINSARACAATALGTGLMFALAFHAVAAAFPTLREQGRIIQSVPGARLVEFSIKPSLFFYADAGGGVTLATVDRIVDPFVDAATARRLTLSRDDALALLREDAPSFALIDDEKSADLARDSGAEEVSRMGRYVLLANPAALRALAEKPAAKP
jgi:hypothetical protein